MTSCTVAFIATALPRRIATEPSPLRARPPAHRQTTRPQGTKAPTRTPAPASAPPNPQAVTCRTFVRHISGISDIEMVKRYEKWTRGAGVTRDRVGAAQDEGCGAGTGGARTPLLADSDCAVHGPVHCLRSVTPRPKRVPPVTFQTSASAASPQRAESPFLAMARRLAGRTCAGRRPG